MGIIIFIGGTFMLIFPIFRALVTVQHEDKRREDEDQMEFMAKCRGDYEND